MRESIAVAIAMIELLGLGFQFDDGILRSEHAVELFRLLPHAKLAVLPNTDHFMRLKSPDWVHSMLTDFLDASMPE